MVILHIEKGDLADQREHFRAVIQIAADLKTIQSPFGGMGCAKNRSVCKTGILGQLVRIDDMGQASQNVDGLNDLLPLEPVFNRHQKQDGAANEKQDIDCAFEDLNHIDQNGVVLADFALSPSEAGYHNQY